VINTFSCDMTIVEANSLTALNLNGGSGASGTIGLTLLPRDHGFRPDPDITAFSTSVTLKDPTAKDFARQPIRSVPACPTSRSVQPLARSQFITQLQALTGFQLLQVKATSR